MRKVVVSAVGAMVAGAFALAGPAFAECADSHKTVSTGKPVVAAQPPATKTKTGS